MTIHKRTHEVAKAVQKLFITYLRGLPLSRLFISLTDLNNDSEYQPTLFDDRTSAYALEKATDSIKDRFGDSAIMAFTLLKSGVARERTEQIGGHYR